MDVLILGWSDIVRRRVLPALSLVAAVDAIHLASPALDDAGLESVASAIGGRVFAGPKAIDQALASLPDAVVYVSGVNTAHARRAEKSLTTGHHTIVDKPAFISLDHGLNCTGLADQANLLLAEATVWQYHDQVRQLHSRLESRALQPTLIHSRFAIPALPPQNFRVDAARGGGVIADMSVYALSPGRVFGGGDLVSCEAEIRNRDSLGLDTELSVSLQYSSGLQVDGEFAFNRPYENWMNLHGRGWRAALSPVFSSPPEAARHVGLHIDGEDVSFDVTPSDAFREFLCVVLSEGVDAPTTWTARTRESLSDQMTLRNALWPS